MELLEGIDGRSLEGFSAACIEDSARSMGMLHIVASPDGIPTLCPTAQPKRKGWQGKLVGTRWVTD